MSTLTGPDPTVSPSAGAGAFLPLPLAPALGVLLPLATGGLGLSSFLPAFTTTKMATPTTASMATTATAATSRTDERWDFLGGGAGYGYAGGWGYPGCCG